ncbi:MAG: DUF748 domain-containing protein [Burkholderiaceae bacterium]
MAKPGLDRAVWLRRARTTVIALVVLLIVVGVVGFFIAPGIVKSVAEKQIAEQLGRKATIGSIKLNPYLLSATVDDFKLYEADGTSVGVAVQTLYADISSASLFKRALVFDQLKVTQPTIHVARLAPQRFSFSDIVDRLAAKPKSDSPFLFSINNIEVDGGVIDIDDRVSGRKHHVDRLRIALPFLSNLPYDTTIFVTPEFAARVDGSAIALTGKAQPFSTSREAEVALDVADLDLTEYIDLWPTKLPFKLTSGKLAAKLALTFRATVKGADGKTVPQSMSIAGPVGLTSLAIADPNGRNAISAKAIDVNITRLDPLNGDVVLQRVAVNAPHIEATRRADGSIDLLDLFRMPTSNAPPATSAVARPPVFSIAVVKVDDASVRFVDQTLKTPATTQLTNLTVEAGGLVLSGATPTTFKVSLKSNDATLDARGSIVVAKRAVSGTFALKGFKPARVAPYLAATLAARIDEGSVAVTARYAIDASGPSPTGTVDQIAVRIDKLRTSLPDEKSVLLGADSIALDGGSFDLGKRSFTADSLKLVAPVAVIKRDAKGHINLRAALVDAKPTTAVPAQGVAITVKADAAQPFTAAVKSVVVERGDIAFDDLAAGMPVHVHAQPLNLKAENVGTAADATIPFDLDAVVDKRGKLAVKGKVAVSPLNVEANVDANQVPVGWLAVYAGERLNVVVASADLNAKGTLRVAQPKAAGAAPEVSYRGSLGVVRMRALDRVTSGEFVQWKTLDIPKVEFAMPASKSTGSAPLSITLGNVALNDFYARVIVNANGRLNLQDVVSPVGQQQSVTTPDAQPTAAPPPTASGAKPVAKAAPPVPAATGAMPLVHVAGVKLTNGRIGITDNFIKPNYSANLTDLNGEVSAIASEDPKPAELKLTGKINGDGALEVTGKIDPFAPLVYTDIAAEAKDIELTRLTPYAIKYAGYAIERGKLSMTVKYHIDNGKLDASNRLFLDQLTFGAKVESPTATKLPVLLAVSLLKNSRGEIDVNLPISGSLSDPEFSVGGVIVRVIINLLTRAITSPFSLIAAAVGGGSGSADELGYVQFKAGVSDMTPQGKTKLETLAKALADRPALKLDIIGRFDPATDPEGIKRDHLLDRLKELKAKDVSKSGDRVSRDDVTIEPGEYASYLARVYDDTKLPDKPRNMVGLAKTIPTEEMEKLLLANMKLDENDPRWLAEARADVVRHYIEDTGKVSPSRVFLVTPKLNANGIDDKGVASRVDFALR